MKTKAKTGPTNIEDLQNSDSLSEALAHARSIVEHLENAESCETMADFQANLENALAEIKHLRDSITESME